MLAINIMKFIEQFPEPQQRTKEDWRKIDRFMKLWHNYHVESIRRQNEREYVKHLEENFMFDENEKYF